MNTKNFFVSILLLVSTQVFAASSQFLNVESIIQNSADPGKVQPYAINVASYTDPITRDTIKNLKGLDNNFLYSTRIEINKAIYYRLVAGNFASLKLAQQELTRIKKYFPEAWLNFRQSVEKKGLDKMLKQAKNKKSFNLKAAALPVLKTPALISIPASVTGIIPIVKPSIATGAKSIPKPVSAPVPITVSPPVKPAAVVLKRNPKPVVKAEVKPEDLDFADKLLEQAKQHFLDRNYARVFAVSNKVIEIGSSEQKQRAMELSGIARERQRKFAQAVAIYTQFLELYPDSKLAPRIKIRLTGLKTMRNDPKSRIAKKRRTTADDSWNFNGSLSQYYRDDIVDRDNRDSEQVNSSLVTDVNLFARKKTDKSSMVVRFDTGLVNDFIDNDSDMRISRAMVSYTDNESDYQLIGGRQSRTVKGVLGRFDGFVYKGLSHDSFNYSVFTGLPVQSSFDGFETERKFLGTSINFKPYDKVEMDVYLVQQQISDLTDRQALGTEFQVRNDKGFFYGIIDYDIFYSDLNNVTAISNYRYTDKWVFNLTYDYRNSPLLTTINALQGQTVASIKELQALLSDQVIYQLAEDRTSKSQNLFFGSNYQIDKDRQLYLSLSISSVEAGTATATATNVTAVAANPSTSDTNLSADYSVRGFFSTDDYTTLGVRLSDTSSSEIISLRGRSRLGGSAGLRYDPRLRLDYRSSKTSGVDQYILKPSIKVTYKANKKVSFEASVGIEYSNFDLPELDDQKQYEVFLGYVYRF